MIRRVNGKVVVNVERPLIYLDHWALRLFARDIWRGPRLLNALTRGTLLVSVVNIAEITRNSGRSLDEILAFLHAVGPRWAPVSLRISEIAVREVLELNPPWLEPELLDSLPVDSTSAVALVEQALSESPCPQHQHVLVDGMQEFRRSVKAGDELRPLTQLELSKTMYASDRLVRLVAHERFPFDINDADDSTHAVAVSHADVMFLDKHWANMIRRMRLSALHFGRVFAPKEVDDALSYLESRVW